MRRGMEPMPGGLTSNPNHSPDTDRMAGTGGAEQQQRAQATTPMIGMHEQLDHERHRRNALPGRARDRLDAADQCPVRRLDDERGGFDRRAVLALEHAFHLFDRVFEIDRGDPLGV